MAIKDTRHFLADSALPKIEGSAPLNAVVERLNEMKRGGAIMLTEGRPSQYVKVGELAKAVVGSSTSAAGVNLAAASGTPLSDFMVEDFSTFFVPIADRELDPSADETQLRPGPDTVYVVKEGGRQTGYFGNHEAVFRTAVETPVFYCSNNHPNSTIGDGTCSQCPADIVTTAKPR